MHKLIIAIAAAAILCLASCRWFHSKEESAVNTHPEYVIDVRSEAEYAAGHLENAALIPHTEIAAKIEAAVPNRASSVALYCRSGHRAGLALEEMQKRGYTNVKNLGSMEAAAKALSVPVVK